MLFNVCNPISSLTAERRRFIDSFRLFSYAQLNLSTRIELPLAVLVREMWNSHTLQFFLIDFVHDNDVFVLFS